MKKNGGGSIVNCSSLSAINGFGGDTAYMAAKSATLGLSRGVAATFAKDNIRVNTITPGIIDTDLIPFIRDKSHPRTQLWLNKIKLGGEAGKPDDVAYAALYLISDESSHVTGTDLLVDGGYLLD
jgi:NAD(P)-dependent dehydrogenase (short-subunit alcohol dehydrogenase family)